MRRYPSDDINKFLWMVRIGGGVFPEIKEKDYLGSDGQHRIDKTMTKVRPTLSAKARIPDSAQTEHGHFPHWA